MKCYILVMFVAGYNDKGEYAPQIRKIQTDELDALITALAEEGEDIGVEVDEDKDGFEIVSEDGVKEVVKSLLETGHWDVGDGAWALTLIDTQNVGESFPENFM